MTNTFIEDSIEAWEKKWHSDGDERHGYVKANNTQVEIQLDDLRTLLQRHEEHLGKNISVTLPPATLGQTFTIKNETGGKLTVECSKEINQEDITE